jgi:hypothetical protein
VFLAVMTLAAPASAAPGPSPDLQRIVFTEKDAILVAPSQVIASGLVEKADWSPSGRYVLAARTAFKLPATPGAPPTFRQSLVLWEAETGKATEIWSGASEADLRPAYRWLGSGDVAFGTGRWTPPARAGMPPPLPQEWLLRIDARRNTLKPLFALPPLTLLMASDREPLAVLFGVGERVVRVLKSDGTLLRQVAFPPGLRPTYPRWSADGRLLVTGLPEQDEKTGKVTGQQVELALELTAGNFVRVEKPLPEAPSGPKLAVGELALTSTQAMLQSGAVKQKVAPLWLASTANGGESRALVSANAEAAALSPRGDSVLFIADGAALVAPLMRLPKAAFVEARAAAVRAQLVSSGKQLGLALIIYANEHEDRLPAAGETLETLLEPYVKSEALFDGFVYTYAGGKVSDIPEPANTMLGYITGPGGRAEVWADGHVTWKKDP